MSNKATGIHCRSPDYLKYFEKVKNGSYECDKPGKVSQTVRYFQNDAFSSDSAIRSEDQNHSSAQCLRFGNAIDFWTDRISNNAKND